MKSTSKWEANGNGDNSSGLNVYPGGQRYGTGNFGDLEYQASFWSSTKPARTMAEAVALYSGSDNVESTGFSPDVGLSVRCIKH